MMFEYDMHSGPGSVCFIQSYFGQHINVAHCYTHDQVLAFLDTPPFPADCARVTLVDGRTVDLPRERFEELRR
jgi:hypothetical protein